ncbi:MAG: protein phosphatase CheZ [Gammaproteobacteria bacterium]|nr:MAG: protein phosphatase CheZ [Gammaproteobacteria bacterium]
MSSRSEIKIDARLEQAKSLVKALENGDGGLAEGLINELAEMSQNEMFQEVGKITRRLHDSMNQFGLDARISELADKDIPDAKERLNYVITMTDQAAHATLTAVEELLPVAEGLNDRSNKLLEQWGRFQQREMPYEEFRNVSKEIAGFFEYSASTSEIISKKLTEILMAQGYQDITGQIIRRVIQLVQDVETNMVELIRLSGGMNEGDQKKQNEPELAGPVVPTLATGDSVQSQDDVDDLLSSLGF